jgi:carbamoyltransferase
LHTVDVETNPMLWKLLQAFGRRTGVPVLLNTSFNENEPIVCTPEQALDCFGRTELDVLVLGRYYLEKSAPPHPLPTPG